MKPSRQRIAGTHAQWSLRTVLLLLTLLASLAGVVSCATEPETAPRAWIDFPRDNSRFPLGTPISVVSHAYARKGVAEVLLLVNGADYRRDAPAQSGTSFCQLTQEWHPQEGGTYTLQAVTYDTEGEPSSPAVITVRVVDEAAPAPTATRTATVPPPPTATATPTSTRTALPRMTPTNTLNPATPTATPCLAAVVSLEADHTSIVQGECTTLRWAVEHAQAVYLNGSGVVGHGTQQVCPGSTTTYHLHVEAPCGNVDKSVTIQVRAAPDTTPPAVPSPAVPAHNLVLSCRASQVLAWLTVSDPSGVVYYVKLELELRKGEWQTVRGWGPVSGKQIEASVQCGGIYRWAVRAQDGAGNSSDWSEWSRFSISLG